jgi:hypothetical protein
LRNAGIWHEENLKSVPNLDDELTSALVPGVHPPRVRLFCMALHRRFTGDRLFVIGNKAGALRPREPEPEPAEQLSGTPTPPSKKTAEGVGARPAVVAEPERPVELSGESDEEQELQNTFTNKLPPCPECGNDVVHSLVLVHDFFRPQCGGFVGKKSFGCDTFLARSFLDQTEVWRYGRTDEDPRKGWWFIRSLDKKVNETSGPHTVRRWKCSLLKGCPAVIVQTFPAGPKDLVCVRARLISERYVGHHSHGVNIAKATESAQREEAKDMFRAGGSVLDAFVAQTQTEQGARTHPGMKALANAKARLGLSGAKSRDDSDLIVELNQLAGLCSYFAPYSSHSVFFSCSRKEQRRRRCAPDWQRERGPRGVDRYAGRPQQDAASVGPEDHRDVDEGESKQARVPGAFH